MKNTKRSLLTSCTALLLCFIMLIGTTFAWFTDEATSANNVIKAGNLDIGMHWSKDNANWKNAEGTFAEPVFNYDKWEPGYTETRYIKVTNDGTLSFKYQMYINPTGTVGKLAEVIDVSYDIVTGNANFKAPASKYDMGSLKKVGTLNDLLSKDTAIAGGVLLPDGVTEDGYYTGEIVICVAFHMQESAGNEYQGSSIGDAFGINLYATQFDYENDSYDNSYDEEATWPSLPQQSTVSTNVTLNPDGTLASETGMSSGNISATLPEGVKFEQGTTSANLNVNQMSNSGANITVNENEETKSYDVHIDGIAADNSVPVAITIKELLPVGLNLGNYTLYHVENGATNAMTRIAAGTTPAHNNFTYDPVTGDVTLYLASFSEIALVAEPAKWEGNRDYSWYTNAVAPIAEGDPDYVIANADQLAGLSAIVGGMDGQTQNSFAGKTVKLLADINIGDLDSENGIVFYPIGYYNSEGTYEKTGTAITSGMRNFEGTFDGAGHTISDFYQNTWEMKGDHDWYDATLQYYRDGMGLFGRVYKGTVKNLTVKNFSSDGEITTTGTIAAYAEGATFENIAIMNCNPRVYNIGNGGIVGCVGWYAKEANLKTTFKNITVDNSNKISALWGSYDVACGGIVGQYYPTSGQSSAEYPVNAGIHFENCHVSAVMDVYNDVCANYQYYAYRYTGMLIGSVRENETINGHVYPKMDGITASSCTVHFGTWNDYYYCEIIDNTTASYTHDYQMSRLTEIKAIDGTTITYLDGTIGTVPASGRANYVIVDYTKGHGTENATCYHFKDGEVWNHEDAGYHNGENGEKYIDENKDGVADLKEDKQHLYLEFNNLVTGYGWGVTSKGVGDLAGVTILDREEGNSVKKFEGKVDSLVNNKTYTLGEIFNFVDNGVELVPGALSVGITNHDENNPVSATIVYDRGNWENSTITFTGTGTVNITIQDYYFCTPTTITVDITDRQPEVKFDVVMNNGDFLHRVGNVGTVALGKLFKAKDDATIGTVSVTVEAVEGTAASGTYTSNNTWTDGTIQFNDTGVVKVTITDNDYCIPTELYLEVVDATNVTGLSGTLSGNVVLLNDCGLSSLTVSGRNAVYGNGFTATYSGNGQYLNNGLKQGVITVSENGRLDNLRVVAPVYPRAYMYYGVTQLGDYVQGGPSSVEGTKTRYHYQLSAVALSGNGTVSNCYIYGGRNNIFVNTGDVTIKDTILECGTVANMQIQSNASHTVTIENLTTIQYKVNPTIDDTSKVMLGAGILVGPETTENPALILNGTLKQYNWVTEDDKTIVSDEVAQRIIEAAVGATNYNHTINDNTYSNLGVIYMNDYDVKVENNTGLPYGKETIKISGVSGQAYSLQGATESQIYWNYENADRSTVNGLYIPQFKYPTDLGGQYIEKTDDGDEFLYREGDTIKVMFVSGDTKEIDLAKLVNISKYTNQDLKLAISVKDENGTAVNVTNGKVSLSAAGNYTVTYTVTDTLFYDKDGNTVDNSIEYPWDVVIDVSLKDKSIPDARFEFDATKQKMGYYKPSFGDVKQYLPFLAGLKIYDYNGQEEYLRFDGSSDFNKIASITITGYESNKALVEIKLTDGGIINTRFLSRANSGGGSTYTGKIKTSNNTIYFVTDSGTSNKDTTTTAAYWYVDYYKFTGNNGVAIQSAQQTFNSTGSSASTPSGNFSTTIKYTVNFDANGGNCGQIIGYSTSASTAVTLPTPARSGYIFAGWYDAATGGNKIGGAGDSYTPSANTTLYAQWGKPCTVNFEANGGSCGTASQKYSGTALTLPTPTRDGYWFAGWYDAATGGNKIGDAGAAYIPNGDITLYAHWQEKIEYTVTYNPNGGTCGTTSATYQGTALTLPTPTRTGYTFNGWFTAASGGEKVGNAGETYTPSANTTLYAQWQINSYTITVTTKNATITVNGTAVSNNGTVSIQYGAQVTVEVSYTQGANQKTTITGADGTTYNSPFNMPAQNVTINASSESGCVTPDTLVTLADGTQKRIDSLEGNEMLLVWDFYKGEYTVSPVGQIVNHGYDVINEVKLHFADGSMIKTIGGHGFYSVSENKFVIIDENNVSNYIGHEFVKYDANGNVITTTLVDYTVETTYNEIWTIVSAVHFNCILNGMLTLSPTDFENSPAYLMPFEIGEGMKYDEEKMQADIEKYGQYTYEDFAEYCTYEQFVGLNFANWKVAVGKGYITFDEIVYLIENYVQ